MPEAKRLTEVVLMPVVLAFIGIGGTYLVPNQQQRSTAEKADADRQVKVLEMFADKITSKDQEEQIFALKILTALEPDLAAQLALAVAQTEPGQSKVAQVATEVASDATARARNLPRIYIHIRDEADRKNAQAVASFLETQGYAVPGVERLMDRGPLKSQVRFFRKDDGAKAAEIASDLRDQGIKVTPTLIGRPSNASAVPPGQFELWFVAGEPAAPTGT